MKESSWSGLNVHPSNLEFCRFWWRVLNVWRNRFSSFFRNRFLQSLLTLNVVEHQNCRLSLSESRLPTSEISRIDDLSYFRIIKCISQQSLQSHFSESQRRIRFRNLSSNKFATCKDIRARREWCECHFQMISRWVDDIRSINFRRWVEHIYVWKTECWGLRIPNSCFRNHKETSFPVAIYHRFLQISTLLFPIFMSD